MVLSWLNVAGCHAVIEWHVVQSWENCDCIWFGFVTWIKSCWWHVKQSVERPWKRLFVWHEAQSTERCAPSNWKLVLECWNVDGVQLVLVWQVKQSCENFPGLVIWVYSFAEIFLMTRKTIVRRSREAFCCVALKARDVDMGALQRKRSCGVAELHRFCEFIPRVRCMAVRTRYFERTVRRVLSVRTAMENEHTHTG